MTKKFDAFVSTILESNSFVDLPDSPPYGFWISPGGDFFVVKDQNHARVALDIIKNSESLTNELRQKQLIGNTPNNKLSRKKYLRVVVGGGRIYLVDSFYYDESNNYKSVPFQPTNASLRTLNDICQFYNKTPEFVYD